MDSWLQSHREKIAAEKGEEAAEAWFQDRLRMRAEYAREQVDQEFREFGEKKAEYVADQLMTTIATSTARYADLPRDHSPIAGLDRFEWQKVLAIIERQRDEQAASYVEVFTMSNDAKKLRRELGYMLRCSQFADASKLEFYVPRLRLAQQNFAAIADAIEAEQERRKA
jgi:hypothetical protein